MCLLPLPEPPRDWLRQEHGIGGASVKSGGPEPPCEAALHREFSSGSTRRLNGVVKFFRSTLNWQATVVERSDAASWLSTPELAATQT
jgi:hypothetical protein